MNRNIYSRAFAACALALACLLNQAWIVRAETAAEVRTWTSLSGQKIEAQFIRLNGASVVLRNNARGDLLVPRSSLSVQDNDYLDKVAPASVSDMLIGEWWGWQTPDRPWQFKLTITRAGNRLVGKGYVRRCMTEAEAAADMAACAAFSAASAAATATVTKNSDAASLAASAAFFAASEDSCAELAARLAASAALSVRLLRPLNAEMYFLLTVRYPLRKTINSFSREFIFANITLMSGCIVPR